MTIPDKLTCQETVELVTDYLEEALLPQLQAQFDQHLESCSGCSIYLEQMRQTIQTLRTLTNEVTPEQTRQSLLQVFQNWKKE